MVGKYAQCAVLLMVNRLGQCLSAVLQAGVAQHPASPGTWADSHHSSMIRDGDGNREPRERGHCGLGLRAVTITSRKSGRRGLFFYPLPILLSWKMVWGLFLHDGLAHPKCAVGTAVVRLHWKKVADHVLPTGWLCYSLCAATGMFLNVAYSPNKCFCLYGKHLAACLNVV